ncbi:MULTISPECIES: XRE family transcriptional regulator [unclassified Luteococcus]|uniref:XRE family transcriptional regulator n=1 Tax=unclassified Luteococcus TaxID=2639923 RepID=UPI00313C4F8B
MTHPELIGQRIKALAELLGMSRTRLAESVGATPAQLSKIESGMQRFPLELAVAMGEKCGVPVDFFTQNDPIHEAAVPTFRRKARASALDQKRSTRLAREAARVFTQISSETGYKPFEFTDADDLLEDVEQVALEVRRAAGIDDGAPVPNVTRALERQGIAVINGLDPHGEQTQDLSGISLPTCQDRRPLVALITEMPGAVARFTLAHEAAHHIWDQDLPSPITSTKDYRELRAHRFAGALLLPKQEVMARISEATTLRGYLPVKADYGLSVGAIVMRARDVGAISPDRARSLQIQLSSLGWRDPHIEPVPVADERPLLLKQALSRATALDGPSLAAYTGLPPQLVRHWARLDEPTDEATPVAKVINLTSLHRKGA